MFIAKRILIISQDTKFALTAKQALERDGKYEVTIFSSGKTAVDFLRQYAQDLALVDFRVRDMPGTDMIDHMRAMQPNIAVIAAPDHPAIHDLKDRYNIQGIVNIPIATRKLVSMIEDSLKLMYEAQPDTSKMPPTKMTEDNRIAPSVLEFWLAEEDGDTVLERVVNQELEASPEASATFERLAAEEPPLPPFDEGSTIRDLRERLTNLEDIKRILAQAAAEDTNKREIAVEDSEPTTDKIPAALILEEALDDSTPIRTFSLNEFLARVQERGKAIEPLPSWLQESEKYVREPDFLPAEIRESEALEYTATVTMQNEAQIIQEDPSDMVTDPLEPVQRSHPVEETVSEEQEEEIMIAEPETDSQVASVLDEEEAVEHAAVFQNIAPEAIPSSPVPFVSPEISESDTQDGIPFAEHDADDPRIVQLAAALTQVALELTADATVIARGGKIVAFAGKLPPSDIQSLKEQLAIEWSRAEQEEKADKSRIIFATVPSSGEEYMISTRSTEEGFTLSLLFSGTRPLHDIRRQSKRLADALIATPEPEIAVVIESPVKSEPAVPIPSTEEVGLRVPVAFLWLLQDPETEIPSALQQRIIKALDVDLTMSGWNLSDIHAPDYIYVFGEMPANFKTREILKELMQKTASLIQQEYPDSSGKLWDDAYLISQNASGLTIEEIQRFINFARR